MTAKVLIENTSENELVSEHGLSIYIEYLDKKILLDAGTSGAFIENAKNMGVELEKIDFAVLSHGHYDHAGGFERLFSEYEDIKLYAMESAVNKYYSASGGNIHEIGIPQSILDKYLDRFVLVNGITKISEGIYIVPHSTKGLDQIGDRAKLYKEVEGELVADDFAHELSLVFEVKNELIVFNSCSHGGIISIIKEVRSALGNKNVSCVVGGLHMKGKINDEVICTFSEGQIQEIAEYLKACGIKKLYTGHCTGEPAIKLLQKHLGDTVERMVTGKVI